MLSAAGPSSESSRPASSKSFTRSASSCTFGLATAEVYRNAVTVPAGQVPDWYRGGMAMTLRLTDEENRRLTELATAEGRSKQEIVKLALAERWARLRKEEQLSEVLTRVLPRYRGLLDRLGEA